MTRALLIAEKPGLMRKVKAVYDRRGFKDTIDFTSFAGHTMVLKSPEEYNSDWKVWKADNLPMIPAKFQYKPSPNKLKMYNDIKAKIKAGGYDYLINCCDPGREGQAIFFTFYDSLGCKIPVKRMWHLDETENEIYKALTNLRDETEPSLVNMTKASKLRAYFDWAVGMNFTTAFSLVGKKKANLGRVMTPTLKIVVDRELEIRKFIPEKFWEIEGDFGIYKGIHFYQKDGEQLTKFNTKKEAQDTIDNLGEKGIIELVNEKKDIRYAPNLHALSDLQIECNKIFGYTPSDTLRITQSLYEKQILSYPRTDSCFLTQTTAIDKVKGFKAMFLNSIFAVPSLSSYALKYGKDDSAISAMAKNKKYVDDTKVSDHYAIVPTGEKVDFSKLTKEEQNVFITVCKRVIAIFMPPVKMNKTTIITDVDGKKFKTNGSVVLDKGFSEIYGTSFANNLLPKIKKGDKVDVKGAELIEKITSPPQRYTDATLLASMINPGKFIDDDNLKTVLREAKGIGTDATRASIIDKLVDGVKMIERKKKILYPTEFGISIIQNLGDNKIASPELTGIWEEKLKDVEKGKLNAMTFYNEMLAYVEKETLDMLKMSFKLESDIEVVGFCPKCGKSVKEGKDYYLCTGYKKDCDFIFAKTFLGAKITKADIKKILSGDTTKELTFKKGTGKDANTWKSKLMYDKEQKKVVFASANSTSEKTNLICPKCNKPLKASSNYYMCSDYKSGCDFILGKEHFGAKITEADFKKLTSGKQIKKTFTWKSGKSSEATLKLENHKYKFEF